VNDIPCRRPDRMDRVAVAANAQQEAITATVIGETIQKVGFRAMIQKQAIMYNLAGYARNDPDGTVAQSPGRVSLPKRVWLAMSAGSWRGARSNKVGLTIRVSASGKKDTA
jgi:hypothetical protein